MNHRVKVKMVKSVLMVLVVALLTAIMIVPEAEAETSGYNVEFWLREIRCIDTEEGTSGEDEIFAEWAMISEPYVGYGRSQIFDLDRGESIDNRPLTAQERAIGRQPLIPTTWLFDIPIYQEFTLQLVLYEDDSGIFDGDDHLGTLYKTLTPDNLKYLANNYPNNGWVWTETISGTNNGDYYEYALTYVLYVSKYN